MPEVHFQIRWPDGRTEDAYSPSTVILDHLEAGARYPLADFVARSEVALFAASERVRQRHGFVCTRALSQLDRLRKTAARQPDGLVEVVSMT